MNRKNMQLSELSRQTNNNNSSSVKFILKCVLLNVNRFSAVKYMVLRLTYFSLMVYIYIQESINYFLGIMNFVHNFS